MNIPEFTNEMKQGSRIDNMIQAPAVDRPPAPDGSIRETREVVQKYSNAQEDKQPQDFSREELDAIIKTAEEQLEQNDVKLKFNVVEENDTVQVEIVDAKGKTIRKIPDDDLLKLSESLKNLDRGFLDEVS